MFVFRKIMCVLFSWNTRFIIRPFALLLAKRKLYYLLYSIYIRLHRAETKK